MKRLTSKGAPEAIGPYSQAIYTGKMIYTSGIIPVVPETGMIAGATIESQTEQVLKNLSNLLKDNGSSMKKVVKTTLFIKDMRDFKRVNDVYATFFSEPYPARSCVEVSRLPKDVKIELEAIAEKGESAADKDETEAPAKKTSTVKKTAAAKSSPAAKKTVAASEKKSPAAKKTTVKKPVEPEIAEIPVVAVSAEPEPELEEIKIEEMKEPEIKEEKPAVTEKKKPAAKKTAANKTTAKKTAEKPEAEKPAAKKTTAKRKIASSKKKADTAPDTETSPEDETK
ncbi:MAG: Rid family detoxifying hydrolase [Lachnospiraceae bacterium]|nr:Rid family detoxifying hydrolase [Lachnospiraceae bacterium]